MDFQIKTSDFLKAINSIEGVINTKQIKSILSNVKIEAKDSKVYLSATDLEISVRTFIDSSITIPGITSLPARQLSSIFKTINFSDSRISVNEDLEYPLTLIRDAENKIDTTFQINGMSPEEIKTLGEVSEYDTVSIPTTVIKEMIRKTIYAVATEETRYVFNGLFFKCQENRLTVVGTDGRRLAKIVRSLPASLPFTNGIIIPHKSIRETFKILDIKDVGNVGLIEGQFYLHVDKSELLSKLIEGNFPEYEQVIPKNSTYTVRIIKEELLVVLKQALIIAEEPSKQIRLNFRVGRLTITSSNPGTMQFENTMQIDYSGEEIVIGFKGDYVADCIKSIDDPEIEIKFSNSSQPVLFLDPSDSEYIAVIMPMKI